MKNTSQPSFFEIDYKKYFKYQLNLLILFTVPVFRNSVFLLIWMSIQYMVLVLFKRLDMYNIKEISIYLNILRLVFGITTFIPIIISTYRDSLIMWYRVKKEIRNEINSS